jgi:hypothetical protein
MLGQLESQAVKTLSIRQEQFIHAYAANNGNGVEAARQAGYKGSEASLAAMASRLLRSVKVQEALELLRKPIMEKFEITAERNLQELAKIAYAPWEKFLRVRQSNGQEAQVKIDLGHKITALIQLNRALGVYANEKNDPEPFQPLLPLKQYQSADQARAALLTYLRRRNA